MDKKFDEFKEEYKEAPEEQKEKMLKDLFDESRNRGDRQVINGEIEEPISEEEELLLDDLPEDLKSVIEILPKERRLEAVRKIMKVSISIAKSETSFSGPIPPPALMKGYEDVIPGSAERILKMAEEQSAHRRSLESQVIPNQIVESKRGQIFGFILAVLGFITTVILGFLGLQIAAGVVAGTSILGVVYAFVLGKRKVEKETRKEK